MVKIFQYGSNMDKERLEKRLGRVTDLGRADLDDYVIAFDLHSDGNKCAVTDIVKGVGSVVGRAFGIDDGQLEKLARIEGRRYEPLEVVLSDSSSALTFVGTPEARVEFRQRYVGELPSNDYLHHLVDGLEQMKVSLKYISDTIGIARPKRRTDGLMAREVYDNPSRYHKSSIGVSPKIRDQLGVVIGDYVSVEHQGKSLHLRVVGAPKELVTGPYRGVSPVSISKQARELLGLEVVDRRETDKYSKQYSPIRIRKL